MADSEVSDVVSIMQVSYSVYIVNPTHKVANKLNCIFVSCRVDVKQEPLDEGVPIEPGVPIPGLDLVEMDIDEANLVEESKFVYLG